MFRWITVAAIASLINMSIKERLRAPGNITWFCVLLLAVWMSPVPGAAAGITGLTHGGFDLQHPPSTPDGEYWHYGSGAVLQLDATTAAIPAYIRKDRSNYPSSYPDCFVGTDVILFNSTTGLSAVGAVPTARTAVEEDPARPGTLSNTCEFGTFGGFVPYGAAQLSDPRQPHPYAGTGFGIHMVGYYPLNFQGSLPNPVTYRLDLQQFRYNGSQFTASAPTHYSQSSGFLPIGNTGHYITRVGSSPAIPNGNDLLVPVQVDNLTTTGIARFKYDQTNGWHPTDFVQVGTTGTEPTLVRDADGSLLFTNRKAADDPSLRLWRASNFGKAWTMQFDSEAPIINAPTTLHRAADGTPFICANLKGHIARDDMEIWPINQNRSGLAGYSMTVMNGYDEFGTSPGNIGWLVDQGFGNVVRLADGQWHSILIHQVRAQSEAIWGDDGTPYTGLYLEEVFSSGEPVPMWTFVAPEPSSVTLQGIGSTAAPGYARWKCTKRNGGLTSRSSRPASFRSPISIQM